MATSKSTGEFKTQLIDDLAYYYHENFCWDIDDDPEECKRNGHEEEFQKLARAVLARDWVTVRNMKY